MIYTSVLAQVAVTDIGVAEAWYVTVLASEPDARPMDGLLEWHVTTGGGVQVWVDPERAGHSTMLLATDDLDGAGSRLAASGIAHGDPQPGGGARLLTLTDPDGNRVVLLGQ